MSSSRQRERRARHGEERKATPPGATAASAPAVAQPATSAAALRRSAGEVLDPAVRAEFERGLNHSFSDVRVHDDARADEGARDLGARAFTVGGDIFFRGGAFAPETAGGRHVLAHELAHVAQEEKSGESKNARSLSEGASPDSQPDAQVVATSDSGDAERQAHDAAHDFSRGAAVSPEVAAVPFVATGSVAAHRWPWDDDPAAGGGGGGGGGLLDTLTGAATGISGLAASATAAASPIGGLLSLGEQAVGGAASLGQGIGGIVKSPDPAKAIGQLAEQTAGGAISSGKRALQRADDAKKFLDPGLSSEGQPLTAAPDSPAGGILSGAASWLGDEAKSLYGDASKNASAAAGAVGSAGSTALDWANGAGNAVLSAEKSVGSAASGAYQATTGAYNSVAPDFNKSNKDLGSLVDMAEKASKEGTASMVKSAEGIPVLSQLAQASAFMTNLTTDATGGVVKGVGDIATGFGNALFHPIDAAEGLAKGAWGLAEHAPTMVPGVSTTFKGIHGLYDIATGNEKGEYGKDLGELGQHLFDPRQQTKDDVGFFAEMGGGVKAWQDKPAEALTRTLTNLAPALLDAGGGGPHGAPEPLPLGEGAPPGARGPVVAAPETVPGGKPATPAPLPDTPPPPALPEPPAAGPKGPNNVQQLTTVDPAQVGPGAPQPANFRSGPVGSFDIPGAGPIPGEPPVSPSASSVRGADLPGAQPGTSTSPRATTLSGNEIPGAQPGVSPKATTLSGSEIPGAPLSESGGIFQRGPNGELVRVPPGELPPLSAEPPSSAPPASDPRAPFVDPDPAGVFERGPNGKLRPEGQRVVNTGDPVSPTGDTVLGDPLAQRPLNPFADTQLGDLLGLSEPGPAANVRPPRTPTIPGVGGPSARPTLPGIGEPSVAPPRDTIVTGPPQTGPRTPTRPGLGANDRPSTPAVPELAPDTVREAPRSAPSSEQTPGSQAGTATRDPLDALLEKKNEWNDTPAAIEAEILQQLGALKDPWKMPTF